MKILNNIIFDRFFYKILKIISVINIGIVIVKVYFYVKYYIQNFWFKIISKEINYKLVGLLNILLLLERMEVLSFFMSIIYVVFLKNKKESVKI